MNQCYDRNTKKKEHQKGKYDFLVFLNGKELKRPFGIMSGGGSGGKTGRQNDISHYYHWFGGIQKCKHPAIHVTVSNKVLSHNTSNCLGEKHSLGVFFLLFYIFQIIFTSLFPLLTNIKMHLFYNLKM